MAPHFQDDDKDRLPEHIERVGYDADSQRYRYQHKKDGTLYEGPEGSRYGELHRGIFSYHHFTLAT
jgi:hypothetical protein